MDSTSRQQVPDEHVSARIERGPNAGQEEILLAYAANPNAAAVARQLKTHERHVRRVVSQFPAHLSRLRRQARQERQERRYAREAKLEEWSDEVLDRCLLRLDRFLESDAESIALKALRMQIDLALRIRREHGMDVIAGLDDVERALNRLLDTDGSSQEAIDEPHDR